MRQGILGEVIHFAGNFAPEGWLFCDGQRLSVSEHPRLFDIIGQQYGGDGAEFALPQLPDPVEHVRPIMCIDGVAIDEASGSNELWVTTGQIHLVAGRASSQEWQRWAECPGALFVNQNVALYSLLGDRFGQATSGMYATPNLKAPLPGLRYVIANGGHFPETDGTPPGHEWQPTGKYGSQALGEIRLWPGDRNPVGWAWCDASMVQIGQNTALYSVLGTSFGGDGDQRSWTARFALPRMTGPIPGVQPIICTHGMYPRRP